MIGINIGNNFAPELPAALGLANKIAEDSPTSVARITETYGSVPGIGLGSVRSKSRLRVCDIETTIKTFQALRARKIEVNYTVNKSVLPTLASLKEDLRSEAYKTFVSLVDGGLITRATVAHPLIMEILSKGTGVPIEISTVTEISSPRQLHLLKKRAPTVDKLCVNLQYNRNIGMLKQFVEAGKELGIRIELLANEFCIFRCPDRAFCYSLQSCQDHQEHEFDTYPMGRCIKARENPVEWLKARFVLPQWMKLYQERLGINCFKVTGRTHSTAYLTRMAYAYTQGKWAGNLLGLWAQLENIEKSTEDVGPIYEISSSALDSWAEDMWGIWAKEGGSFCDLYCDQGCNICQSTLDTIGSKQLRIR